MDWQMLGALGEIFGAIGVIATLGYLASQIRQSRTATQQAAVAGLMEEGARFLAQISASSASARLWRRGIANDQSLSIDELVQFRTLVMQLAYTWERLYYLAEQGHVDEWLAWSNAVGQRDMVSAPGFRAWFESRKDWISSAFREALERDMAEAPSYKPLGATDSDASGGPIEQGTT